VAGWADAPSGLMENMKCLKRANIKGKGEYGAITMAFLLALRCPFWNL